MLLGYNTNGFAHHDLVEAIELLADIGYRSVAITIDHGALNPNADGFFKQLALVERALVRHDLRSVIETGARYLLDPRHKHEPTLVSADPEDRARRVEFLSQAIDIAQALGSDCVSLWSGVVHDRVEPNALEHLVAGLRAVLEHAAKRDVWIGFEPEPGMLIATMHQFGQLTEKLGDERLRLTLDIGHLHCQGEVPLDEQVRRWAPRLANVHIEDMRAGRHEHLMFGEGEIDFPPVIAALKASGYAGGLHVELSRHSHEGPAAAQRAFEFLSPLLTD